MMQLVRWVRAALCVGACGLGACGGEEASALPLDAGLQAVPAPDGGFSVAAITGAAVDARAVSLCELAASATSGAAFYHVDSLTSYNETTGGALQVFTYVQLSKVQNLSVVSAPDTVIARVPGGYTSEGSVSAGVSLHVGETDAIFLSPPAADNADYFGLSPLGVFRLVSGGYSNGQLFTMVKASRATLAAALQHATGPSGCMQDALPDGADASVVSGMDGGLDGGSLDAATP